MSTVKTYLYKTLLLSVMSMTIGAQANGQNKLSLEDYRWKNRLILVFTPSSEDVGYRALQEELAVQKEEVIDRVIRVFHILESGEIKLDDISLPIGSGDYLRDRYSVRSRTFTVLLIGKDGGVKLRREGRAELKEILTLIDTMPMRQREMRVKSQ